MIGTVKGDLHNIGKNLVAMMLEGAGYEVIDLGVDVTPDKLVEAAKTSGARIIGLSALLTTTISSMEQTLAALTEAGLRGKVKAMSGGAPLSETAARQMGADGYAPDTSRAVKLARTLISP